MKLTEYLTETNIKTGIKSGEKIEIIGELLDVAKLVSPDLNRKEAIKGLLKRESLGSTGIGKGVAIPHSGLKSCSRILPVIGLSKKGLDYDALDGEPVKIFFLILYPEDQIKLQLKFLARVSRLLRNSNLIGSLIKCSSPDEVMMALKKYETEHFS